MRYDDGDDGFDLSAGFVPDVADVVALAVVEAAEAANLQLLDLHMAVRILV